jgi:hypothetical protein
MPSKSKKQHNFMEAIAHSEKFAKKVGVPQSVGKEFAAADKGKTFRKGGSTNPFEQGINKQQTHHGQMALPNVNLNKYVRKKEGGMATMKMHSEKNEMKQDTAQDKKLIKKAFGMHDKQEHKGEHTNLSKLKKGGMAMKKMAKGGMTQGGMGPKTMSKDVEAGSNVKTKFGQSAVQKRGMTKGTNLGDSGPTMGIMGGGMKAGGMCGGGKAKKMAKGGSASSRGDGIAMKGKTKGKWC